MIEQVKASMGKWDNLAFRIKSRFQTVSITDKKNWHNVPVIINNFNRLEWLQQQLNWCEKAGLRRIYIIDNNSTFPDLLAFYRHTPYTVFQLDKNVGFLALWKTIIFQRFRRSFYIYTDPDILPLEDCPLDVIPYFFSVLDANPQHDKVGFGLSINDLPEHYPLKDKVVRWEKKFWQKEMAPGLFEAPIDTTFALYRPGVKGGSELKAIRTGYPYMAKHLTWYVDVANANEEELFYQQHAERCSSWYAELAGRQHNLNY